MHIEIGRHISPGAPREHREGEQMITTAFTGGPGIRAAAGTGQAQITAGGR
jgi:hypothetical protein